MRETVKKVLDETWQLQNVDLDSFFRWYLSIDNVCMYCNVIYVYMCICVCITYVSTYVLMRVCVFVYVRVEYFYE
jgi:hypothetical protein